MTHEQDCPLCEVPAKYMLRNFDKAKHFRCINGSEFIVASEEVEKTLSTVSNVSLAEYVKMAKLSNQNEIFVIKSLPVSDHKGPGPATDHLCTGLRPRHEWKLQP
ncbi:MAG: hypothetical protein NTAFB09_11230 [Nitrosospira sp.]